LEKNGGAIESGLPLLELSRRDKVDASIPIPTGGQSDKKGDSQKKDTKEEGKGGIKKNSSSRLKTRKKKRTLEGVATN